MPQTRAQSGVPPKRTERFYSTPQRRSGRNRPWASPEAQQENLDPSGSSSESSMAAPKSKRRKKAPAKATPGGARDSTDSTASDTPGSSEQSSDGLFVPDFMRPVDELTNGITDPDHHSTTIQHGSANGTAYGEFKAKSLLVEPDSSPKAFKDHRVDHSGHFEFGGVPGVSAMMIGFPALMYFMWIGATYYDGNLPWPAKEQTTSEFLSHLQNLVYVGAYPSLQAWIMYWSFVIYGGLCYLFLPGIWVKGKRLDHEGGRQLDYYCSGLWSFYCTIIIMAVLHLTGVFKLYTIIDEFGPLLSVAIISGYSVSIIAYFSALYRGAQHRMSGWFLYDFFMGAELNPRMFGFLDFKMFFEVRLPWYILLMVTAATAARQYENYGYISGEVAFLLMAHFLYANACSKGEECIVTTWDVHYEKWGFMLIFWNLAGVPLSYCHCTLYLANHPPSEYRWNRYALASLYVIYLFIYWIWDTANSQKNRFRQQERGTLVSRNTFPQLPWQTIKNPKFIETSTGDSILVDGWYGYARKIHYTCDLFFALSWGLVTGFRSPFPWFYPVFFAAMITHRAIRDIQRCKAKYGASWDEYIRRVPYLFIPGVI